MMTWVLLSVLAGQAGAEESIGELDVQSAPAGGMRLTWSGDPRTIDAFLVERSDGDGYHVLAGGWIPARVLSGGAPGLYDYFDEGATQEGRVDYRVTVRHTDGTQATSLSIGTEVALKRDAAVAPSSTGQPGEKVRIAITDTGLYYLDATRISESLVGTTGELVEQFIRDTNMTMSCQGRTVSWFSDTNASGVYFYAEATNNRYSSENIYWLIPGDGALMAEQTGAGPVPGDTNTFYSLTKHYETAVYPQHWFFTDPEDDFWVWNFLYGTATLNIPFSVDALPTDASGVSTGVLTVAVVGATKITAFDPEHCLTIYLNDVLVASNKWNDYEWWIPRSVVTNLLPGANVLSLRAIRLPELAAEGLYSFHFLKWFEIEHPRLFVATSDELHARVTSNQTVTAQGFSTNEIHVLDVTDPMQPIRILDVTVDVPSGGTHRASFDAIGGHDYFLASSQGLRTPAQVTGRSPANLKSPTNRADHVIIVAPGLESAAEDLSSYRRSQGLDAMVVSIDDVFDRFSYGLFTPWAIRSFLQYATENWEDKPLYVVLAGSGSYDYKNYKGYGDCVIPAASAYVPDYGLRNSDAPLADLSGGRAPEVAISRYHCQTLGEFEGAVAKVMAYERWGNLGDRVQFNAGNTDPSAGNFTNTCNRVALNVSTNYVIDKNYITPTNTVAQAKARMKSALNTGAYMVCYYGHGYPDQLGYNTADTYLKKSDLASITNRTSPTLFLAMTCDFADFGNPGQERLGEALVNRATGVAGLFGFVGPTYNDLSEVLGGNLLARVFVHRDVRVGEALRSAAAEYETRGRAPYVLGVMCYLGDPATLLPPVPASYEVWRSQAFSTNDALNPAVSGRGADADNDGIVNELEFLWDLDPTSSNSQPSFAATLVSVEQPPGSGTTNDYATLTFNRRKWLEGVELRVERTYDLVEGIWTHGLGVDQELDVHDISAVLEQVTVRVLPPLVPGWPLFVRLVLVPVD